MTVSVINESEKDLIFKSSQIRQQLSPLCEARQDIDFIEVYLDYGREYSVWLKTVVADELFEADGFGGSIEEAVEQAMRNTLEELPQTAMA